MTAVRVRSPTSSSDRAKSGGTALRAYSGKRDFSKTSEPKPAGFRSKQVSQQRFVVQKHDARRLHFDLRLELNGVLKSWAVTKGPSMKSGVRRLAVETENHPLGYLDWEGVIPKGQYGGGTMIIWDSGTWETEASAAEQLQQGKLTFTLSGERLKGRFTLVRMKPEGKRHNWLLIKGDDEFALKANEAEPTETRHSSLKTGMTNTELAGGPLRPDHQARQKKLERTPLASTKSLRAIAGAKGGILPAFVEPSLAMSVPIPPHGKNWIHEIKHDGYRVQARLEGGKVKLLTRKGLDWTSRFPPVARALENVPVGAALIDGEIVVEDQSGHSSFSGLQADLRAKRHTRLTYFMFDLLHCNGVDLRQVPLAERKKLLHTLFLATPKAFALRFNEHVDDAGHLNILTEACRLGLEGIVSKRSDLPYQSGRGPHWQKSKCTLRQEFVIVGFVPSTTQKRSVGSLVLGYYEDNKLVHAGRAGTGLSANEAAQMAERLESLRDRQPQFANALTPLSKRGVIWVRPELGAEIEYRGWSSEGLLRHAAIVGLRDDKPAAEIVLEQDRPAPSAKRPAAPKSTAGKKSAGSKTGPMGLTHPEKLLWPDVGMTKQMLLEYYELVAERCVPHMADRVLALLRCPEGTAGQCFFAKHAWMGTSDHVQSVDAGSDKPMLAIHDFGGLASLVQMNVLEIHLWGSTTQNMEKPDRMIFDLDPDEAVPWPAVRDAALEVKQRLATIGLQSFIKSTGGKGLHVVVPLEPQSNWDQVKDFSKAFAMLMAQDSPGKYIATMSKARRRGKIFIDYLRNGRGATAIAPFSTRARPGAPVAMPLDWKDIAGGRPVFTAPGLLRLGRLPPDPWRELGKVRQRLPV